MAGIIDTYLRCFIASDISDAIRQDFSTIIDRLKKHDADVKWAPVNNIHLTLKFLGNTPQNVLLKIRDCLFNVVLSYNPFYIRIYMTGVFPNRRHPNVIWIGVGDSAILRKLHIDIENAMVSLGFKKDQRTFNPHLTIGRVRSQKGIPNLINELDSYREKDFGNIHVRTIKLMKSELNPQGATYSCLYEIPLGNNTLS
jgi:2'-5' RNA ligase